MSFLQHMENRYTGNGPYLGDGEGSSEVPSPSYSKAPWWRTNQRRWYCHAVADNRQNGHSRQRGKNTLVGWPHTLTPVQLCSNQASNWWELRGAPKADQTHVMWAVCSVQLPNNEAHGCYSTGRGRYGGLLWGERLHPKTSGQDVHYWLAFTKSK